MYWVDISAHLCDSGHTCMVQTVIFLLVIYEREEDVMTVTVESTTPSAVIDRVSLVLDAFDGPGRLTLAQIVRRTGLPRSSAHRMLERLVKLRWLRRNGRDYELGMRLVELGSLAVHQDRLHRAAIPLLHDLHRATGLVVHLAVLDGSDVVYLEKIGDRMTAAIPTRVGGRQPAHCAAVGKAMLAYNEEADVVDLATRKTKYSISTPAQLTAELAKVRAHGVAFDREESLPGFGCVAAPIGGPGEAVAAVSVCGPMSRMMFDQRLAAPVRMTAMGIWRNVEDGPQRVAPTLQPLRPLRGALRPRPEHRECGARGLQTTAMRHSDPQIAEIIEALDAGFPPVHTMTGAEARAVIRSRFVAPRTARGSPRGSRRVGPRSCRRHPRAHLSACVALGPRADCWCTPTAAGLCSATSTATTGYVAASRI